MFEYPKTPRRKWTQPDDSTAMHLAQRENFAIFHLKGRQATHFFKGIVPASMIKELDAIQKKMLAHIKEVQAERMKINKKAKGKKK